VDPAAAAGEAGEFFGQPVNNISDAAKILASSSQFQRCAVQRFLGYYLGLKDTTVLSVSESLFAEIVEQLTTGVNLQPSQQDILLAILLHPSVINSFVD